MSNDLISREALKRDLIDNYGFFPAIVARALEKQPAVDAVILPKGRPGDYVLWTNGVSERLLEIGYILICEDGMRYDLGCISPFTNHSHILAIVGKEEAEKMTKRREEHD